MFQSVVTIKDVCQLQGPIRLPELEVIVEHPGAAHTVHDPASRFLYIPQTHPTTNSA